MMKWNVLSTRGMVSLLVLVAGCKRAAVDAATENNETAARKLELTYATGFEVTYFEGYKKVVIRKPYMKANRELEYVLVQDRDKLPAELADKKIINIPVGRMVCTSTTHIPMLDMLDETGALVGFPTTDYISSVAMRRRIDEGWVKDLGSDKEMNIEELVVLAPDVVMAYSIYGDYGRFAKMEQLGVPVILNAEYLEEHPLGRAEWIKLVGVLTDKEELADSVFRTIAAAYRALQRRVSKAGRSPACISGVVYGDTWYMPGGQNYAAKLIADAGGRYLWAEDETRGFLELSFEAVYDKGREADFWIGVANFEALGDMLAADNRYGDFAAFQRRKVYTNNWRKGAKGGSEFLEMGYMRPDIILSDLIKIFHPGLLPDGELYFHKQLE